jgi:HEAT repeat protein
MPVKASAAKTIDALVGDLSSTSATVREGAIARLTVIGARAVKPLITLVESHTSVRVRIGGFAALDAIGDARALAPALRAIDDRDSNLAIAAIGVARRFLRDSRGAAAVDRLTGVALDRARPDAVRAAALHALRDLDRATIAPLLESLANDPVIAASATAPVPPVAETSLGDLLTAVETARERQSPTARAAAHLALAKRGSRIALYDLREWLEAARQPLPDDAVVALSLIGDASCLEAIAKGYARSRDESWRARLVEAFRAVTTRERLTRRHAAVKKAARRSAELVSTL